MENRREDLANSWGSLRGVPNTVPMSFSSSFEVYGTMPMWDVNVGSSRGPWSTQASAGTPLFLRSLYPAYDTSSGNLSLRTLRASYLILAMTVLHVIQVLTRRIERAMKVNRNENTQTSTSEDRDSGSES